MSRAAQAGPRVRVLMIGWEFPPLFSGGLGVACEGLVGGLAALGCEVVLLLPRRPRPPAGTGGESRPLRTGGLVRLIPVSTELRPYGGPGSLYGEDLVDEVSRLAAVARVVAREERFDLIHAHDWMTYPAGLAARDVSGRPFLAHVHATEYSRSAGRAGDPFISGIERVGLRRAARVLCVSRFTAGIVHRRYGVAEDRIRVVHNAIEGRPAPSRGLPPSPPVVLFAGRLTRQKGPARFVEAARLVLERRPDVRFVMAGTGDRLAWLRRRAEDLGLGEAIAFPGFVERPRLGDLYRGTTVYVLPSVVEPFGLTVLEALRHGVPTIASRQAGVNEVVRSPIRVDAGDVNRLAREILRVLDSRPLQARLSRMGRSETARLSWRRAAARCLEVYREIT